LAYSTAAASLGSAVVNKGALAHGFRQNEGAAYMSSLSPWMLALATAVGSGGAAIMLGHGWLVALIFALTGVALAIRATRRDSSANSSEPFKKLPELTSEVLNQPFRVRVALLTAPLGPFQKFSVLAFVIQIHVCLVLIVASWLLVKLGWSGPELGFVRDVSSRIFPVQPGNAAAQAMIDTLFVPLALFNFATSFGFAAALLHSASPIFRNIRSSWKLLALSMSFLFFAWSIFSPIESYQAATSLKKRILEGDLIAYLGVGCVIPIVGLILAYVLPEPVGRIGKA
jgi:hypothetical protein